jgi:CHAT domain-containing protein
VTEVGALYPAATLFTSDISVVDNVHSSLDGAGTAHIASHAFFQFENPMFSSLRLADGDLNVYDIERLGTAPGMVVLSACDSGFTDAHAGEEIMGLSSALLSMGTKSIIASVGLVPDSQATKDLMVALHSGLVSGLSPSEALHQAQSQTTDTPEGYIAASSFVCIGAG